MDMDVAVYNGDPVSGKGSNEIDCLLTATDV